MSKHRYSSVNCQAMDWAGLAERSAGGHLVVGVDVAKEDFYSALQDVAEHTLVRVKWQHPAQTRAWLGGVAQLAAVARVEVVMESSGVYGDALRWQLQRLGIAVYRVSAKRVHDSAEVYDGVPSLHDAKAAELIAKLHWEGRSSRWEALAGERRGLLAQVQRLSRSKARYRADYSRLEALLARHWPEALHIIGLDSVALQSLIADYGSPAQIAGLAHQARARLRQVGRNLLPADKIEALIASAGDTLGVPCVLEERVLLRWQAQQLLDAHREVHASEQALGKAAEASAVAMPKVLGPVTSAVLLATQGDPGGYPSARGYVKSLGLNLTEHSSGKHKGQLHLSKRGSGMARLYLYFAALRLLAREPIIQHWYGVRTARAGAIKLKQVIALMRKLAHAIWHHAHGEPFVISRLVNPAAVPA